MLFSSLVFVWYFLPIVFITTSLIPNTKIKNIILLISSLFFYSWGEPKYILLMIFSILLNYTFGIFTNYCKNKKLFFVICVILNLALLGYFKYFNFFVITLNRVLRHEVLHTRDIALPIGISFYTFQALSYVIDVYREKTPAQENIFKLALYVSFFPQLIAGPIVKYHDVALQLEEREVTLTKVAFGIKRFVFGLSKKVILANTFAAVVDEVMREYNRRYVSPALMWGIVALYSMQIYYDFSGYSDMAIGLGKMFGFDFLENFNYPYMATSIADFWRRWHMSLSTWFKEYLYIPLGGNRKGLLRTCINTFIVFFCTGLWHGASFSFIFWGLYYAVFLIMERLFLGNLLEKNPIKILNRIYTIFIVMIGWLLFRVDRFAYFIDSMKTMFYGNIQKADYTIAMFFDKRIIFYFLVSILLCGPIQAIPLVKKYLFNEEKIYVLDIVVITCLFFICTMMLINNTYNPFIYFRF